MENYFIPNFFSPFEVAELQREHGVLATNSFDKELCKKTYCQMLDRFAAKLNSTLNHPYEYKVHEKYWYSLELYDNSENKFVGYSVPNKTGFLMPHILAYAIYSLTDEMICELDEMLWTVPATTNKTDRVSYCMFGKTLVAHNDSKLITNLELGLKLMSIQRLE